MERFVKNLGSWALTTKVYIILHRALKEPDLAEPMAKELKSKEHILYTFQKKVNDESFGRPPARAPLTRRVFAAQTR